MASSTRSSEHVAIRSLLLALVLTAPVAGSALAQSSSGPDNPSELYNLRQDCFDIKKAAACAEDLFTSDPVHVAIGSIAPQDGFGAGLAYVGHKTTPGWRINWNADAVGSTNASWRAGFYLQLVPTPNEAVGVSFGPPPAAKANLTSLPEHPVINVYAQTISLNTLTFFGSGSFTTPAGRSFYGMTETILGTSAVRPVYEPLKVALYGELNGRLVDIRASTGQPSPPTQTLYTEATAPGLTTQPGTLQLGEGIRMRPVMFDDLLRLNYNVTYQQYVTPGNSTFSFQRLTVDLSHQIALYRKSTRFVVARDGNGPDACALDPGDAHSRCPSILTRNLEGSFGVRLFAALSMTPGGEVVPFYFQPTLGGSDINGNPSLSSYQDYRFRAPDVLLVQESFEHSIGTLPLGFTLRADQGTVALTRGGLGSSPWIHSVSTGLTLRAGGFPEVDLLFSWGGNEGTHTITSMNPSLLGGAARPSLY
jgi:hypothetical protein